jgi:cell division protein ZapA
MSAKPAAKSEGKADKVKQVEVAILGQSYMLACRVEEEKALQAAVAHVDQEMRAIRDIGKIKARDRIAVLAALNIAHGLLNPPKLAPREAPAEVDLPLDDAAQTNNPNAGTTNATVDVVPSWRLQALLSKIDRALAADNQLL